jgi:hypothetical protein
MSHHRNVRSCQATEPPSGILTTSLFDCGPDKPPASSVKGALRGASYPNVNGVGNEVVQKLRNRPTLSGRQRGDPVPEVFIEVDGGSVLARFGICHARCMGACRGFGNAQHGAPVHHVH